MEEIEEWLKGKRKDQRERPIIKKVKSMDIDTIVRKAIDSIKDKRYTTSKRETRPSQTSKGGDFTEVKPKLINRYKIQRRKEGASTCSINRELALMKHAFNLALKEWEWVEDNPVKKVSMEKEPPARDRWLSYDEDVTLYLHAEVRRFPDIPFQMPLVLH